MTVHRFFVDPSRLVAGADGSLPLPAELAHQVTRVLRLREGDELVLLDGLGSQVRCRLAGDAERLTIVERGDAGGEPRHRLTIGQALIKGDGLETVVRQGTELGVVRFRLMVTRRCVARRLSAVRLQRLRIIAREAAEQSERGAVPRVDEPQPMEALAGPGVTVLAAREEDGIRLGQTPPPGTILVGPEGGFHPDELAAARSAGATIAWLGPRVLRAESVAIAAAAVVLSRTGDFA
jgi:16S rRNA (uracil1498-N3)-methyltransferase